MIAEMMLEANPRITIPEHAHRKRYGDQHAAHGVVDIFTQVVKQDACAEDGERNIDRREEPLMDHFRAPGTGNGGADDSHRKQEGFEI